MHDASKAVLQEVSTYSLLNYTGLSLALNLKHPYKVVQKKKDAFIHSVLNSSLRYLSMMNNVLCIAV